MDRDARISFLQLDEHLQASTPTAGAFLEASRLNSTPTTLQKLFSPLGNAKRVGKHGEAIREALQKLQTNKAVRNSSCKRDLMEEFMETELIPDKQAHVKEVAAQICARALRTAKEQEQAHLKEMGCPSR